MIITNLWKKLLDSLSFKHRRLFIRTVNYFRTIRRSDDLNLLAVVLKTDK